VKYYEVMLVLRTDIEAEEQQEVLNGLQAAITKEGGEVSTILDWYKRRLSYEINKHREGHYYLVYFSGQGNIIPELEHYFRVNDTVIRYMVSSVEEAEFNAAVAKASAATAAAAASAEAAAAVEEPAQAAETEGSEEEAKTTEETVDTVETVEVVEESAAETDSLEEKEDSSPVE